MTAAPIGKTAASLGDSRQRKERLIDWVYAQPCGTGGQARAPPIANPCHVLTAGNDQWVEGFVRQELISMLMMKERRPAIRTLRGWAIEVLREAGAIHECEEHGWARDRADPHARERAVDLARRHPPAGTSGDQAVAEVRDVLDSIGDTCLECPPDSSG